MKRLALATGLLLCACATETAPPPAEVEAPSPSRFGVDVDEVGAAAHAIAIALHDASLRTALLEQFRSSRFPEGKVEFRAFLRHPGASGLIRASARAAGKDEGTWRSKLAELPALELYLPIEEQRQNWDGDGDILVLGTALNSSRASRSGRSALPAFDTAGKQVMVGLRVKPSYTLISLVPVETDFRPRPSFAECDPEDDCGGGGGGTPTIYHDGWYADALRMVYDGWTYDDIPYGHPEFEVWMAKRIDDTYYTVPLDADNKRPCASEEYATSAPEHFNYDNTPNMYTEDVLFVHGSYQALHAIYGGLYTEGTVFVTENDDTPCPSSDRPSLGLFDNTDIGNDDELIYYVGLARNSTSFEYTDSPADEVVVDPGHVRFVYTAGRIF